MYHLLALLTCVIWGSTFVSTKVLLHAGLSPALIFFLRFLIAYVAMAAFSHKRLFCATLRDEVLMCIAGITGGSLFFWGENTALLYTHTDNVAFLTALPPLFLVIYSAFNPHHRKHKPTVWIGSLLAIVGIYFVSYGTSPDTVSASRPLLGNALALGSSVLWAIYQLVVTPMAKKYGTLLTTRKLLGYGTLTISPFILKEIPTITTSLSSFTAIFNIIFLGLVASGFCYFSWNIVMKRLGSITSANYLYINPIVTCIAAYIFLGETVTPAMMIGGSCIIAGVYIALRK